MVSSTELFCLTRLKGTGSVGAGRAKHAKIHSLTSLFSEIRICSVTYVHVCLCIV